MKLWRLFLLSCLGLLSLGTAHALFYDDFPDGASIKPTDELEERIWQEAEVSRGQFVRGDPSPQAAALADHVRRVVKRRWPDLAGKFNISVIDNADVLAISSANGDLIISTGMLMRLDNEPQLLAVVAREMSHVVKRHAVRSVYAARLGSGANVVFQAAVNASSFMGTMSLLGSFQVSPEMLIADGGKAFFQTQLNKIRDNMADNFLRRMSATGFEAMVKTSLFGYSESLESESDEYALLFLEKEFGTTDAFKVVMKRLADEAAADEKKFSAFYGNEARMKNRLEIQSDFDGKKDKRLALRGKQAKPAASPASSASAVAPAAGEAASVVLAADAIVIEETRPVVAVVVKESEEDESPGEGPLVQVLAEEKFSYPQLLSQIAMPVAESEMEAGHLGRVVRNIERQRDEVAMPDRLQVVLAESLLAAPDPKVAAKGEPVLTQYIQAHPSDARGLKLMGLVCMKRGDHAKAETYLQQALNAADSEDEKGFIEQYLKQVQKKKAPAAS